MRKENWRVYEGSAIRGTTGDLIRPGGLALTDRALALCQLPAGARVLDVGCGPGATVEHLIARHCLSVVGLDASMVLAQSGRRRDPAMPMLQAVAECLPFEACLRGAMSQSEIAERLRAHNFQVAAWQDHSDALKQFAAQLIWTHGSLAQF